MGQSKVEGCLLAQLASQVFGERFFIRVVSLAMDVPTELQAAQSLCFVIFGCDNEGKIRFASES